MSTCMPYSAPMVKGVDYASLVNEEEIDFDYCLTDLEFDVFKSLTDFLEGLKEVFLEEKMIQVHELVIAHLCAYLGTVTTTHTVKQSASLEESLVEIIKHQANESF